MSDDLKTGEGKPRAAWGGQGMAPRSGHISLVFGEILNLGVPPRTASTPSSFLGVSLSREGTRTLLATLEC